MFMMFIKRCKTCIACVCRTLSVQLQNCSVCITSEVRKQTLGGKEGLLALAAPSKISLWLQSLQSRAITTHPPYSKILDARLLLHVCLMFLLLINTGIHRLFANSVIFCTENKYFFSRTKFNFATFNSHKY